MKKITPLILAIAAAAICYILGRTIGLWYADVLKDSGGMVTASDMLGCKYGIPIVMALCGGYMVYRIADND